MPAKNPITIIGGGLAGLVLGIGLRQRDVPVTIIEAGRYPRHRVCGEFISGRGQEVLTRLQLYDEFLGAGARLAQTAVFVTPRGCSPIRQLSNPALCLSRFSMDALLARRFRNLGGQLRENERSRDPGGRDGVILATGRRLSPTENGSRWFGLKVHARNVILTADLEMHTSHDGYIGLCRLPDDEVNICGLFRRPMNSSCPAKSWQATLLGNPNSRLNECLRGSTFDETSFCSIAGLSLQAQKAGAQTECRIGDALTMIPPVTGNGMSMAFETAEIAIEPVASYSRGETTWDEARKTIAAGCDQAFDRRLAWAGQLHRLMFLPGLEGFLGSLLLRSDWLWTLLFAKTR